MTDDNVHKINSLVKRIPKNSGLKKYPLATQKELLQQIMDGESPYLIAKRWGEKGLKGITTQQLIRVKRHLLPIVMRAQTPDIFFAGADVKEQTKRLEFLLTEQYSRIVEAISREDEEKDLLKPNKFAKINPNDDYADFSLRLTGYYEGTISDVDRKILLSIMDRQGQNPAISGMLKEFLKLYADYISIKKYLRVKDEDQQESKFNLEVIGGITTNDVGEQLRNSAFEEAKTKKKSKKA